VGRVQVVPSQGWKSCEGRRRPNGRHKVRNHDAPSRIDSADTIEEAIRNAYTGAGTIGSGANIENKLRQAIAAVLKSKTKRRDFTDDEITKMEAIAQGDYKGNVLRLLGKMVPTH
jgi:hypothetical protein